MDEQEKLEFDLEDIIREFSSKPPEAVTEQPEQIPAPEEAAEEPEQIPEPEEAAEEPAEAEEPEEELPTWTPAHKSSFAETDLQQTRRMDPVQLSQAKRDSFGDTIRLDGLRKELEQLERQKDPALEDTVHADPFSERWEPDYEQPMGEYIPPQPILFHPRSRLRELKRKLVAGPEKRYYALSEKGVGKLQAAIFISLLVVLLAAGSTVMYAMGMVQENRLRLMVFGQFLAMLVSALLGSFQLIEGIADLGKKRFTLNTLLVFTFLFCCADGIRCLQQLQVPCCAAFSLAMLMSLWNTYHRRSVEISQMDTLRKATRLDGVCLQEDYLDGIKGFVRCEGQVEDFMDHYDQAGKPLRHLQIYSFVALLAGIILGCAAGFLEAKSTDVMSGISTGIQVSAVCLLAAMPASAFVCQSRPTWILEGRLHKLRTVICGWRSVEALSGKAVVPLTHPDIYPAGTVRMNGMKFFGSRPPEEVIAYAAAVITADNGYLSDLFAQVLSSYNGRHYPAAQLEWDPRGGVSAVVETHNIQVGPLSYMKDIQISIPENAKISHAVYVAIDGVLSGLFAISYEKNKSSVAGLSTLSAYRKLYCVLTSWDFMLTHHRLSKRFGIKPKRFLLPDYDARLQLQEKTAQPDAPALILTTSQGLAPIAYGITGARVLRTACRLGAYLHMIGGILGLGIMALLVALGSLELLTPVNMFLYQLVWLIPGLLITEWTRSI